MRLHETAVFVLGAGFRWVRRVSPLSSLIDSIRELRKAGRLTEAHARLVQLLPGGDAAVCEEAGHLYEALGDLGQSLLWWERAAGLAPERAAVWVNLAAVRAQAGDRSGAVVAARSATDLAPQWVPAWINLGSALADVGDYGGAVGAYTRAMGLAPGDPRIALDFAQALFAAGEVGSALQGLSAVLRSDPGNVSARSLFLLAAHHASNDPAALAREHHAFGAVLGAKRTAPAARSGSPPIPLRVGLLGGDFRRHSVWYFLSALLRELPLRGVELHAYHTDRRTDEITVLWQRGCHRFTAAGAMDDEALARDVEASRLDVLVNLGGHTTAGRPELFLRRMAPVQASFLGYPGPIGSPNSDVWIADEAVAPTAEPSLYGGIARLPHSYFCFEPGATPNPAWLPLDGDSVLFGSFNVLGKVSAVTVRLWSAVLAAVPGSRLLIKSDAVAGPAQDRLMREFAQSGIDPQRILWYRWSPDRHAHLSLYRSIDIGLDTFPYNGATTTCEALWMGVPIVSLSGRTPASRMGRSILGAALRTGDCVQTESEYVGRAAELAARVDLLRAGRSELRNRLATSPLCDGAAYADHFASLLRGLAGA